MGKFNWTRAVVTLRLLRPYHPAKVLYDKTFGGEGFSGSRKSVFVRVVGALLQVKMIRRGEGGETV